MWISSVHIFKSSWARIGKILAQSSVPQCGVLGLGQFLGFSVAPTCRRWRFNRSAIALRMGPGASTSYFSRMVRTVVRTHVVSLLLVLLELLLYVHSWFEPLCTKFHSIRFRLSRFWHRRFLHGQISMSLEFDIGRFHEQFSMSMEFTLFRTLHEFQFWAT